MSYKCSYFLAICVALGLACAGRARQVEKSQKRVDLARDLLARGQDAAAENEAQKAIAFDPRNEEAYNLLGLVYLSRAYRTDRLIEIEDCLEGATGDDLRAEADQNMRLADKQWRHATDIAPDYGEAWQNRAVVSLRFRDWDAAIQQATEALAHLARLENEALTRANLGWAYYGKHEYARAAGELLKAAQLGPTSHDPDFCLGNYRLAAVLFERKDYEAALERLGPFLEDPKRCPLQETFYLAAQTALRLHDTESARQALGTCVEMAPRSCQARRCGRVLREIAPVESAAGTEPR